MHYLYTRRQTDKTELLLSYGPMRETLFLMKVSLTLVNYTFHHDHTNTSWKIS